MFRKVVLFCFAVFHAACGDHSNTVPHGEPVIGIDLGTEWSTAAVYHRDKVEFIPSESGEYSMRSVVAFTNRSGEWEILVGQEAYDHSKVDPINTITGVKRFMGKMYDTMMDVSTIRTTNLRHLPYRWKAAENGIELEVTWQGEKIAVAPEEVSALIIEKWKVLAEQHLKREVKYAVITVPSYFDDNQRMATFDAGLIAGLNVLRLINGPTAAALGLMVTDSRPCVLVDFEAGGLDIVAVRNTTTGLEVFSRAGGEELSGDDYTNAVYVYFIKSMKKQGAEPPTPEARAALHRVAEDAKLFMSDTGNQLWTGHFQGVKLRMSREKFVDLMFHFGRAAHAIFARVMRNAGLSVDIVMLRNSGGQTEQLLLHSLSAFQPRITSASKNRANEFLAAAGAALVGAKLSGMGPLLNKEWVDILPYTTGLALGDVSDEDEVNKCKKMEGILEVGAQYPTSKTYKLQTGSWSPTMHVCYKGDGVYKYKGQFWGGLDIGDLATRNGVRKPITLFVTLSIDKDGLLNVTAAWDKHKYPVALTRTQGRWEPTQIAHMQFRAAHWRAHAAMRKTRESWKKAQSWNGAQSGILDTRSLWEFALPLFISAIIGLSLAWLLRKKTKRQAAVRPPIRGPPPTDALNVKTKSVVAVLFPRSHDTRLPLCKVQFVVCVPHTIGDGFDVFLRSLSGEVMEKRVDFVAGFDATKFRYYCVRRKMELDTDRGMEAGDEIHATRCDDSCSPGKEKDSEITPDDCIEIEDDDVDSPDCADEREPPLAAPNAPPAQLRSRHASLATVH